MKLYLYVLSTQNSICKIHICNMLSTEDSNGVIIVTCYLLKIVNEVMIYAIYWRWWTILLFVTDNIAPSEQKSFCWWHRHFACIINRQKPARSITFKCLQVCHLCKYGINNLNLAFLPSTLVKCEPCDPNRYQNMAYILHKSLYLKTAGKVD